MNCTSPTGDRGYRGSDPGRHPDVEQLCRALADWSTELRLLLGDQTKKKPPRRKPRRRGRPIRGIQAFTE